ncbi:hypothetical protein [Streptomyces zingiberis]|uniref:AG1 protein n=1 Tax=Streptomyces zingiberis TaxID=2053010 RepID=A0ABX1C485_9ACTN|nr:hypothetical protein [Streptomyces zingiberis]NJQ02727.1 hypothetical protein [Streptomyces zingiberis]
MSFDEEWTRLKAEASTRTRLNNASRGGGGGAEDLVVRQDDLGRVGNDAFKLHGDLRKAADIAGAGAGKDGAGSSMRAAQQLTAHNFATGAALSLTVEIWDSQAKTLLQALAHISNHLDFTRKRHSEDEADIEASLRNRDGTAMPVSKISQYFQ